MVFANRHFYYFLVVFCVAVLIRQSNARPPWRPGSGVFSQSAECHKDDELLDLCQRCAKLSRQYKNALSDCCSTTDMQARRFCSDFVYFGRGEVDFIGD